MMLERGWARVCRNAERDLTMFVHETGAATVPQGPGLTNTATALIEAVRSSPPLVLIPGDTAPGNLLNQQSLGQEPFVRATGAGYVLVQRPADTAPCVRQAIATALGES